MNKNIPTNVKNVKKISNIDSLRSVMEDMLNFSERWTLPVTNWEETGLKIMGDGNDAVIIPARGKTVLGTVGDYVITMNNNTKFVVFSPELKERIDRNDFSWISNS